MAENQLIIGSLPVLRGAYDAGTSYYRDNQVTMYGSTFQSLTDGNMGYPPAELREDGKVYAINTDKWIITANAIEAYNAGERISALEATFSQEENPEYVSAVVDAEGRVLFGLTADGRPYFPKNDTYRVESNKEWLAVWLDAAGRVLFGLRRDGSAYVAKAGFLDRLSQIEQLLKDSGISGDDLAAQIKALQTDVAPLTETFSIVSNEEWLHAVVDAEGRLLFGIKADTGEVVMPKQDTYRVVSNAEWMAVWLDTVGHVLFGIRKDGTFYAAKHEFGSGGVDVEAEIEAINATLSTMQDTLTSLKAKVSELESSVGQLQQGSEALEMLSVTDDVEGRTEMALDADGRVLAYRDKDGVKHEEKLALHEVYDKEGNPVELATKEDVEAAKVEPSDIDISELSGVSNHNTLNLLVASEMQKTFNDGTHSFTPPNDGYEMSNPIGCRAGDWFTRTGTATGMVVVTDADDKNGTRLFGENGQTLGSTFQIPSDMTWVRYIRMAAEVSGASDGSVVICKGKEAYTGDDRGDFLTADKLRIEKRNLSKEVAYVKSEDGSKFYELYVDASGVLKTKEIDPDIIPAYELPSTWIPFTLRGDFDGYFDRMCIQNKGFLVDLKAGGPVNIKDVGEATSSNFANFEHAYNGADDRYIMSFSNTDYVAGRVDYVGITIFDADFNVIDTGIGLNGYNSDFSDIHDFIYLSDGHLILYAHETSAIKIPGTDKEIRISGPLVHELKKNGSKWNVVGEFKATDYPLLCTDAFGELGNGEDVTDAHSNTIALDYDDNLLINCRNWDTLIKIRRVENEDGTVTLGSKTLDYDEAIIGRVGGRHNSGYLDSKRVLNKGFSFTDVPEGLSDVSGDDWEEWQWFHAHDAKYWGMKTIGEKEYPTYTLFDNNYWTKNEFVPAQYNSKNKHNNVDINPKGYDLYYLSSKDNDEAYSEYTHSRIIQVSVDWENHEIADYRVYYLPKKYSKEQSGATMYDEGVISIAFSYSGEFGLWDFNTAQTTVNGHIYKGARELFLGKYDNYFYCYRANTYKINN